MAVNKVLMGERTLVDLTNDSVTPETLAEGVTAHDASGNSIVGTMTIPTWDEIESYIVNEVAKRAQLKPEFANSIAECTDTTKLYILPDGYIYAYTNGGTVVGTITEQIIGTADNPWGAGRLSSGNPNGASGYVTTPYIDLTKYSVPFELHLGGIPFSNESPSGATASNLRFSLYGTDKSHLVTALTNGSAVRTEVSSDVTFTDVGDGTVEIAFTPTVTHKSGVAIGYARFSGYGAEANANVYITYETEVSTAGWTNTGHAFVPADYEDRIIELEAEVAELKSLISQLT